MIWVAAFVWPAVTQARSPSTTNPNARVLNFAQANLGRQVGNGECWTLAFEALRAAGARHDQTHRYIFGQSVTGQMMPGDIVQFENCLFQGSNYWMQMAHHTAIIHSMESPGVYRILHQNVGGNRRVHSVASTCVTFVVEHWQLIDRWQFPLPTTSSLEAFIPSPDIIPDSRLKVSTLVKQSALMVP